MSVSYGFEMKHIHDHFTASRLWPAYVCRYIRFHSQSFCRDLIFRFLNSGIVLKLLVYLLWFCRFFTLFSQILDTYKPLLQHARMWGRHSCCGRSSPSTIRRPSARISTSGCGSSAATNTACRCIGPGSHDASAQGPGRSPGKAQSSSHGSSNLCCCSLKPRNGIIV